MSRFRFAAAAILLAIVAPATHARTYIVGVENIDYFPQYRGSSTQYEGYAREVLDAFAKAQGLTFTYQPLPIKRLFDDFFAGNVDFKYPDNPKWSTDGRKDKTFHYSDPVVTYVDGVSVLPARLGKGVENLKSLGIVRGFTAFDYLDAINAKKLAVQDNSDFAALLKTTIAGRNDGAYGNIAVVQYTLRETLREPGALVFDPGLPHTKGSYLLSTQKHKDVIDGFNAWMKANAGSIAQLKAKFQVE